MNKLISFTPREIFDLISGKEIIDEPTHIGYMSAERYAQGSTTYSNNVIFDKNDLFTLYREGYLNSDSHTFYVCLLDDGFKILSSNLKK